MHTSPGQTPPIATLVQAEWRCRGAGERGRTPTQRRWARDGPSARPGGATPERGDPAGAQPGAVALVTLAETKSDAP